MKFWAFFIAKLAAVAAIAIGLKELMYMAMDVPKYATAYGHPPFLHDLSWTTAVMVHTLICIGMVYLVILDQKYRCRTCLRRLKMPVNTGSWDRALIFAPPKTEYICAYGHGTMKRNDLQITGNNGPVWVEHKDIWEELESIGKE